MFKGYVAYGDTDTGEVINVARLVKYAEEGAVPDDTRLNPDVGDYGDLAAALGDEPYRTVTLDQPPWYDATNPDSADFAGLLPLEITGLDGSTRTRAVTEALEDGGNAGRSRAASRVLAVSAVALASTDAALDAGLAWLTGVLHPPCAEGPEVCSGAPLSLFAAAPAYCNLMPNLDADPVTTDLVPAAPVEFESPGLAFHTLYSTYLSGICGAITVSVTVESTDAADHVLTMDLVDTGGTIYATGSIDLDAGDTVELTVTVEPSPGFPAGWQPILRFPGTAEVTAWTYTRQPYLTVDECLGALRRSFRNVVTIDGPTVTDTHALVDGTPYGATVEWTWVATDPFIYGDETRLFDNLPVDRYVDPSTLNVYAASTGWVDVVTPYDTGPFTAGQMYMDGGFVLGGGALPPGARVLLKDQTDFGGDGAENGIWVWPGPFQSLVRATDMDTWAEVPGKHVFVENGVENGGHGWSCTNVPGGTFGTTPITWVQDDSGTSGGALDDSVGYSAPGIIVGDNELVTGAATDCPLPAVDLNLCGDDPDLPSIVAPPAPPTLADPGMAPVSDYTRRELQIPPELSPQAAGAVSMVFHNTGDDRRGIRVRLYADDDPDFGVADECAFETEFWITYLAADQTVTIDGPNHQVTTTCLSGLDADHERNMRGPYGGPFSFPLMRCGSRYHVIIDVPTVEDGGGVTVDMSVTRRGA